MVGGKAEHHNWQSGEVGKQDTVDAHSIAVADVDTGSCRGAGAAVAAGSSGSVVADVAAGCSAVADVVAVVAAGVADAAVAYRLTDDRL